MEILRTDVCITVSQTNIIERLLKDYGMENCRPVSTPFEKGFQLGLTQDEVSN